MNTEKIADRMIQQAIEEGLFDNLPGRGQPIQLDDDPLTPPHLRLGNRILKNANVLPDWAQLDAEIRRSMDECSRTWARVAAEYPRRRARAGAAECGSERGGRDFAAWYSRTRRSYLNALRCVNHEILKFNLSAPNVPRPPIPYRLAEETERFDAAFPPPPGADASIDSGPIREKLNVLSAEARVRYEARRR